MAGSVRNGGARLGMIAVYGTRAPSPEVPIGVLSGGNVQRYVLARDLDGTQRLLIVANPCFGQRARIMAARNAGTAALLVSEDLDEILERADRIVVTHGGRVAHEILSDGADPQEIGQYLLGHE